MKKYGYVYKIQDTPNGNYWTHSREIELKDGTIVYGCEGDFEIEASEGKMFTQSEFLIWLGENTNQENAD